MAWAVMCLSFASAADVWNFKSFTPADIDAVTGATTQWSSDDGGKSFKNAAVLGKSNGNITAKNPLTRYGAKLSAGEKELEATRGLLFSIFDGTACKAIPAGKIQLYMQPGNSCLKLNANNVTIVIPNLKAGQRIIVNSKSASSKELRYLKAYNLNIEKGFGEPADPAAKQLNIGTVQEDGDVMLSSVNGMLVYDIMVENK